MKYKSHHEYLKILKQISVPESEWLKLDSLLFSESWYVLNLNDDQIKTKIKQYLRYITYKLEYRISNAAKILNILYYRGRYDRDNYCQHIDDALSSYSSTLVVKSDFSNCGEVCEIDLNVHSSRFSYFCSVLGNIRNSLHREYLAAYLVFQYHYLEDVKAIINKYKVITCYFDGGMFENIVIQYAKHIGIKTVSFQHGQPVYRSIYYDKINQAQILNFNSDYFIACNEFTKTEFMRAGIKSERIKVIGSFKPIHKKIPMNCHTFGLFLDSPSLPFAIQSNSQIITLAESVCKRLNYTYIIKPHPSDDANKYRLLTSNYCKCIQPPLAFFDDQAYDIDFGICHASSIYLDLYANYTCAFAFSNPDYSYQITNNADDLFTNLDQITNHILLWEKKTNADKIKSIEGKIDLLLNPYDIRERLYTFLVQLSGDEK